MVGIELVEDRDSKKPYPVQKKIGQQVILEARRRGVIIRPLGDVIILMPPFSISAREIETLVDVVYESIQTVTEKQFRV
jgi:adenosylmethionine-8-amino-7-oxononanoate aminotransferase